ncbi:A24 family peptidase [Desulfovibrio sp. TomC]|uniref:A24 family peptidase n=1 Tax=Desulfovibrio sp. TomC TaxID=1562888 RepID=UPI000574A263|nr:A24 family peptidase [Desulfovibrio sp. TomC]KHK00850.1 Type IV prepilin peptidase TadV/CpaA [Desulfovibrio sp. TomC]
MPLPPQTLLAFAVTAVAVLAGAAVDVTQKRIPNLITFPAMLALIAVHTAFSGLPGLTDALLGLVGGFIIFLIPHLFRVLGAGDVKLMAAVGAGLGPSALLTVFLFTSLAGGVQSLAWLMAKHRAGTGKEPGYRVCYGPAIAVGTLATMALPFFGQPYLSIAFPRF